MLAYSRERKEVIETLPDEPAEGGEGWVYKTTEAGTLAKIFKEPAAEHRREKVEALIASPPHDPPQAPDGHRRFAWPQEMLCDVKTGEFIGYTMAQIPNGKPLDQFFDPGASEYREKPFRVRLAIAVAELIADIHRHHLMLVVGDINPSNILADARGRVALIDLDSVQMTTPDGRNYPCPVGSTYYTPAELIGLGKKLGQVRRTQEHDRFGLAAIIFQLLFDGCHPFAAVGNDCTPLDRIRAGDWPYTNGSPYRPPPSAPPFRALPRAMQTILHAYICRRALGSHGAAHGGGVGRGADAKRKGPWPSSGGRACSGPTGSATGARASPRRGGLRRRRSCCCRHARLFRREVAPRGSPRPGVREPPDGGPGNCRDRRFSRPAARPQGPHRDAPLLAAPPGRERRPA